MPRGNLEFRITIEDITKCGQTCREMTLVLENVGTVDAHGIDVDATLFTDGRVIWAGSKTVGDLPVGESVEETREVELGVDDGALVKENGMVVTGKMIVRAEEGDRIYTQRINAETLELLEPPVPNLTRGDITEVDTDDGRYYLISQLPNEPDNRVAVTDTNYQLVSTSEARKAISHDHWTGMNWDMDWSEQVRKTENAREEMANKRLFGRALQLGWNITEILILLQAGVPPVGPTFDIATDAIDWGYESTQKPYQKSFQEMTGCLSNAQNVRNLSDRVTSRDDFGENLEEFVGGLQLVADTVDEGTTLGRAWGQLASATSNAGATSSVRTAIQGSKGFFVGFAVSTGIDIAATNNIERKTNVFGIGHAHATQRLPVIRRIEELDSGLKNGSHSFGDGVEYYVNLQSQYQMAAAALAGTQTYWEKIANSPSDIIWENIGTNPEKKAEETADKAETMLETSRYVGNIHGMVHNSIKDTLQQSVNMQMQRYSEKAKEASA